MFSSDLFLGGKEGTTYRVDETAAKLTCRSDLPGESWFSQMLIEGCCELQQRFSDGKFRS